MVACSERQRVRGLLAEAINMLCRNSLKYKFGFSVEGLLGITIDNSQVLLINIQEEIKEKPWPDSNAAAVGKSLSSSLANNSPMDLSTSSSHSKNNTQNPAETQQPRYTNAATSQAGVESRVSPETSDIKPEVDLCLLAEASNGPQQSPALGNGEGSRRKRSKHLLPSLGCVKQEPTTTTSHVRPCTFTNNADEVIYIKDEDDSDTEISTSTQQAVVGPTTPPFSSLSRPFSTSLRIQGSTVTSPPVTSPIITTPTVSLLPVTSPVSPPVFKIEDDSCSSSSIIEDGNHSQNKRESSPIQAPIHTSTSRPQDATKMLQKTKKCKRKSLPSNTLPGSSEHQLLKKVKKVKKGQTLRLQNSTTVSDSVLNPATVPHKSQPVNNVQGEEQVQGPLTEQAEIADVPPEDTENSNQGTAPLEGDQSEWPVDIPRRPRASYSTAYKLMIVRKAIETGNMRATARRFGIHFKQVWQWSRNKEKLLAMSLSALRSPRLWQEAENRANLAKSAKAAKISGSTTSSTTAASASESLPPALPPAASGSGDN